MSQWPEKLSSDTSWEVFKQCAPSRMARFERRRPYWLSGYLEHEAIFYKVNTNLRALLNLRLVSYEWNMASTAILRKHHW
jgi:hypothetical protein